MRLRPQKKETLIEEEYSDKPMTEYPVKYRRTIKDVKILGENGDATVHFFHECKNSGEKEIQKIVHLMHHDGKLKLYEVCVNGLAKKSKGEMFIEQKVTDGETIGRLARKLKLTIDLEKEKIRPGQTFGYDCRLEYEKVYERMYEPHAEWTSYHIMMPTDSLKIMVTVPKGSRFDMKSTEVLVRGFYEIEDFKEEQRCKEEFPPILMQDGTLLMWEINKPKIACTYFLYFRLVKR